MSTRIHVIATLSCLFFAAAVPVWAQDTAEEMLQSALYKQEVEGDIEGAIELLAAIAGRPEADRGVAARALLQLGLAYETLGSSEAEGAYRALLRAYPDQAEAAARAQARLALVAPGPLVEPDGLVARRLWYTRNNGVLPNAVSPDGRQVAFVQWADLVPGSRNSGDLAVAEVATGEFHVVGRTGPFDASDTEDTYVVGATWSRTGDQIAYSEISESWDHDVLHVVNADGSGHRVVSDNVQNAAIKPQAWSSDGSWIVALVRGWDAVQRIARISMEDGSTTVLKTLRSGFSLTQLSNMTLSLSPDDRFVAYAYSPSPRDEPDVRVLAVDGTSETVVAPNAATDLNPLWTPDGTHLVFLSDRSGSPDLWAVEMSGGRGAGDAFVVHPHVGPIVPLGFTAGGALTYRAEVSESDLRIVSWGSDLSLDGGGEQLSERFVGYNDRAAWSPDGSRIAYLSARPGRGLSVQNHLVVKALEDGVERDIELTMALGGESRPAWSRDGREIYLQGFHVERTETGSISRRAGYRIDLESEEIHRAEHIWDYAGFWNTQRGRFVSERQSDGLRSLGLRVAGQRDITAYTADEEPLRPGESLLWVRNGILRVRAMGCASAASFPRARCWEGDELLYEPVVELPEGSLMRGWELSPDGTRIAYLLPDTERRELWNLWVRSVTMEEEPTLLSSHRDPGGCGCVVRWTPDGEHLVYGFDAPGGNGVMAQLGHVYRVGSGGGEVEELDWPLTRMQLGDLTFDPRGGRAVLEVGGGFNRTEVWALSGFPWQSE